jgi:hypothetical protein
MQIVVFGFLSQTESSVLLKVLGPMSNYNNLQLLGKHMAKP